MVIMANGTLSAAFFHWAEGTMILQKHRGQVGTTIIEATIAACTSAMFLGSLFAMNITSMKTLRTARQAAVASQVLQQRIETLRIANWHQMTDATWLKSNVLSKAVDGADFLGSANETVTLVPYDSATPGNTQLTRTGQTAQIVSNTPLLAENAVKVIWTVAYTGGVQNATITRQAVAIIAKGGVARW